MNVGNEADALADALFRDAQADKEAGTMTTIVPEVLEALLLERNALLSIVRNCVLCKRKLPDANK